MKTIALLACGMLALVAGTYVALQNGEPSADPAPTNPAPPAAASTTAPPASAEAELPRMEANEAVMVTVQLEFPDPLPSIAEALKEVERQHQPEDGQGRVFAILDAYGGPTEDGKKLHISMHVSTEKPGVGALVFKRTGEVLWKNQIVPATKKPSSAYAGKGLHIMVDDDKGKPQLLDGKIVKTSILEATVNESGEPLDTFWPEGEAREVTFFYSTCGCPVKVVARREGDKTVRLKDTPVIFPDDPGVALTIAKLMRW
jgi:hypothetical protein